MSHELVINIVHKSAQIYLSDVDTTAICITNALYIECFFICPKIKSIMKWRILR